MPSDNLSEYGKEWEVGFKEKYELELELEVHLWEEGKYVISWWEVRVSAN